MKRNRMIIKLTIIFTLLLFFSPQSESRIYNYSIFEVSLSVGLPADFQKALDLNSNDGLEDEEPYSYASATFRKPNFHNYETIASTPAKKFFISTFAIYSGVSQRSPPLFP